MATFNFNVKVTDNNSGETLFIGYRPAVLTDNDLQAAAAEMEAKGGIVTELKDLGNLDDKIGDQLVNDIIYVEELSEIEDWENISIDYDKDISDELMEALNKYISKKNVDFKVECVKDGKVTSGFVNMDISPKVFNKMVEIASIPHDADLTDIAWLKLKGYDEHEELIPQMERRFAEFAKEGGYDNINYDGSFPYQVYENL